jgi:HNH endonuclease
MKKKGPAGAGPQDKSKRDQLKGRLKMTLPTDCQGPLTAERLRDLLLYSPETGVFTWKQSPTGSVKVGDVAGRNNSNRDYYRQISVDGRSYKIHRLAFLWMTGSFPPEQVDHIDLDKNNNAWSNLRPATPSQNNANWRARNQSGLKGTFLDRRRGNYYSRIGSGPRTKHLGTFETAQEAHGAYVKAARELYGEYARAA